MISRCSGRINFQHCLSTSWCKLKRERDMSDHECSSKCVRLVLRTFKMKGMLRFDYLKSVIFSMCGVWIVFFLSCHVNRFLAQIDAFLMIGWVLVFLCFAVWCCKVINHFISNSLRNNHMYVSFYLFDGSTSSRQIKATTSVFDFVEENFHLTWKFCKPRVFPDLPRGSLPNIHFSTDAFCWVY